MISQTVVYALRAIVTIAQQEGRPCTSREIAEITQVPSAYLSKLMQGLVHAGLVRSQRGLHGGFMLTKTPEEITTWDIINVVEPIKRIQKCPLKMESHQTTLCPLHLMLDKAIAMLETIFRETTIADLLARPGSTTPLCAKQKKLCAKQKPCTKQEQPPSQRKCR